MDTSRLLIHVPLKASLALPSGSYPVVSASLDMMYGSIPTLSCVIPADKGFGGVHIHSGTLVGIASSLGAALGAVGIGSQASMSLLFEDGKGMSVEKWVVVGAGMTRLSADGSEFGIEVTIAHPAIKVGVGGGYFMSLKGGAPHNRVADAAPDPITAGQLLFSSLSASDRIPFFSNEAGGGLVADVMASRLKEAADALTNYFDPSGLTWPLVGKFPSPVALRRAICRYWEVPGSAEGSLMDSLNRVLSSLELAIVPDFHVEKLPIEPRFPWGEPKFSIHETSVAAIEFPGIDTDPICGVALAAAGGGEQPSICSTNAAIKAGNVDSKTANSIAYMPKSAGGADPPGKFLTISPPDWLEGAAYIAAAMNDQRSSSGEGVSTVGKQKKVASDANKILEGLVKAKVALMKNVFVSRFKTKLQSAVTMPFMEVDAVPGRRAYVDIGGEGGYTGFVSRVVHSVDTTSGVGSTVVFMTHCAPPAGFPEVSGIDKAPMYS